MESGLTTVHAYDAGVEPRIYLILETVRGIYKQPINLTAYPLVCSGGRAVTALTLQIILS